MRYGLTFRLIRDKLIWCHELTASTCTTTVINTSTSLRTNNACPKWLIRKNENLYSEHSLLRHYYFYLKEENQRLIEEEYPLGNWHFKTVLVVYYF